MNRQQMLSILNTMSDDNLAEALNAVGVEAGGSEGLEFGDESAEGLESWNSKDVSVEDPGKPAFLDKSQFVKQAAQPMRRPDYMNASPEDSEGLAEFITQQQQM